MRKIILCLFIIVFCFSIGIAELQEEELSKEERAKIEKRRTNLEEGLEFTRKQKEITIKILSLYEEIEKLEREYKIIEELDSQNMEEIRKIMPDVYELLIEASKPEEKDDLSWLDKYAELTKKEERRSKLVQ